MQLDSRLPILSINEPSPFYEKGIYAPRLNYPAEFIYDFRGTSVEAIHGLSRWYGTVYSLSPPRFDLKG